MIKFQERQCQGGQQMSFSLSVNTVLHKTINKVKEFTKKKKY